MPGSMTSVKHFTSHDVTTTHRCGKAPRMVPSMLWALPWQLLQGLEMNAVAPLRAMNQALTMRMA